MKKKITFLALVSTLTFQSEVFSQKIQEPPKAAFWGEISVPLSERKYFDGGINLAVRNVLISGEFSRLRGEQIPPSLLEFVIFGWLAGGEYVKDYGTSNFAVGAIGYHNRLYFSGQVGIGKSETQSLETRKTSGLFGFSRTEYHILSDYYTSVPLILRIGLFSKNVNVHLKAHIQMNPQIAKHSYLTLSFGLGIFKQDRTISKNQPETETGNFLYGF